MHIQYLKYLIFMNIRTRQKKFFVLVLFDHFDEVIEFLLAVKYLSFTENDIFLQVISGAFGYTEVFHCFRHIHTHFITQAKKVIHGIAAGHDHSSIIKYIDTLLPEFFGGYAFHVNKRPEIDLYAQLFSKIG